MPDTAKIQIKNVDGQYLTNNGWQGGSTAVYEVDMLSIENAGYAATTYSRENNLVSSSWNTLNGDFADRLICLKDKLIIKFDVIDATNLNKLLYNPVSGTNGGIYEIIKAVKHRFFNVIVDLNTAPCLQESDIYYLAAVTKFERFGGSGINSLFSVELHFIQATSTKINPFAQST